MEIEQINKLLDDIIANCDVVALPMICKRKATPQGFLYVKNRIINLVTSSDMSIDSAMAQLESELTESV